MKNDKSKTTRRVVFLASEKSQWISGQTIWITSPYTGIEPPSSVEF